MTYVHANRLSVWLSVSKLSEKVKQTTVNINTCFLALLAVDNLLTIEKGGITESEQMKAER